MKEQVSQSEPRFMKLTEEVIFGLGGYFKRRLATINRRRGELLDLRRQKEEKKKELSKNKVIGMLQIISYRDWLTDYETEQLAELNKSETRLTEVMAEVTSLGRVDRAEAELLTILDECTSKQKSNVNLLVEIGRMSASEAREIINETIDALSIINPEYQGFLMGV